MGVDININRLRRLDELRRYDFVYMYVQLENIKIFKVNFNNVNLKMGMLIFYKWM